MAAKVAGVDQTRGAQDADLAEIATERVGERPVRFGQELYGHESDRRLGRQAPTGQRRLEFLTRPVRAGLPLPDKVPFSLRRDTATEVDLNVPVRCAVCLRHPGIRGEPDLRADGSPERGGRVG
jgi:hypothetical protein